MAERLNVEKLLAHLGIRAQKVGGGKWKSICPDPRHEDSDPSWSIIDKPGDRKHGSHHCFSCGFSGGPWELAAAVWGCEVRDAGKRLRSANLDELPIPKSAPVVQIADPHVARVCRIPSGAVFPSDESRWFAPALEYLRSRNIPQWQIEKWGVGYAIRGRLRNRVIVPVRDRKKELLTFTARAIVPTLLPRYREGEEKSHGASPHAALWGEELFEGSNVVTIAEGVFSAMALERAGAINPCALLGSELPPEKARKLGRFESVIVATDPDPAGNKVASVLSVLGRRARLVRMNLNRSPDDYHEHEGEGLLAEQIRAATNTVDAGANTA